MNVKLSSQTVVLVRSYYKCLLYFCAVIKMDILGTDLL